MPGDVGGEVGVGARDDDRELLIDRLRDRRGRTSVNDGCGTGVCGACTVLGAEGPVRSCLVLGRDEARIRPRTLEDVAETREGLLVREAFARHHASQCGFCTPGFLLLAVDLLERSEPQTDDDLCDLVAGSLCRCTGYRSILDAFRDIARAAGLLRDEGTRVRGS